MNLLNILNIDLKSLIGKINIAVNIYYRTDTGKYYELDTALPRVRRTSGTLYPTSNISRVSVR